VVGAEVVADEAVVASVGAAQPLAVGMNSARAADHQSSQEPGFVGQATRAELGVLPTDPLGGLEDVLGDDRRHGDRDPFLRRPDPSSARAPPTLGRGPYRAVVVGPPDVSLVAQQAPHHGGPPWRLAGGGRNALDVKRLGDLADGPAASDVVVEDALDHRRFRFVDLEAGRPFRRAGDNPIAVGSFPGNNLTSSGAVELAPPVALGDLGPLVLGDDPLHLRQQPGLRVIERRRIDEEDTDAEAFQFVEDHHLIGVGPGQAIGGKAPHRLDEASLGRVPQGVQPRTVQARPRVAVVDVLSDQFMLLGGDPAPQRLQLGADRPLGLLSLAGDPGVERHPHCATSSLRSSCCPQTTANTSS
jgi:hypothetical protein